MIRKFRHLLPNHVLKRIYVAQVRSVMEYGCAVWSGDNKSMLQKLTGPFLPRKSCQASTSASKTELPHFVAILQDKKQVLAFVPAMLTASSLRYVVTLSSARS